PALGGTSVFDIEFAPAPDGITYLGTQDSVRKSTDGGLSWVTLNLGIGANDQVFDVALDPSDSSIIWAGIADAAGSQPVNVMRSTDGGATWTDRTPPHAPMSGRAIAIDPNDSNTVIAVFGGDFGGGEAWVTTDGGDSWMDRSAGLPGNAQELFLGTSSLAVFHSTNGGDTFVQSSEGISQLDLFSIDANPLDPDEIAVAFQGANDGGVFSSTDGGTTWLLESAPPTRYSNVHFAPNGTLYAISSGPSTVAQEGLYRRENNGSWTPLGPDQGPLYESDLDTMRFSVNDPNLILLGGADFGVAGFEGTIWRTSDAGQTWTKVYEVGDFQPVTDIDIVQ